MKSFESIESPSVLSYLKLCIGALLIGFILVFVLCSLGLFQIRSYVEIVKVIPSPDQKLKAVVFLEKWPHSYSSVNISVLNSSFEPDPERDGNIFFQSDDSWADAKWIDNHSLQVIHTDLGYCRLPEHFTAFDRDLQIKELVLKGYKTNN